MKKDLILIGMLLFLSSCSASKHTVDTKQAVETKLRAGTGQNVERELLDDRTFLLKEISTDKSYGFSENNPVEVGGVDQMIGPLNERRYLNALMGPNGEEVSYYRAGSINPENGKRILDNYRVTWEGAKDTVSIFINMYDYGDLKAPVGFTIKQAVYF